MKRPEFNPVPGIWRFHALYLMVTLAMGWSFFPYSTYGSLLLISGACVVGILLSVRDRILASHMLALAIGLGTPVVILGGLRPLLTVVLFFVLIFGIVIGRDSLF